MLFNSALFLLLFFPVTTLLYFLVPQRARWGILLIASCYFYAVGIPIYLFVLFAIVAIDFTAGLLIERAAGARRRMLLTASLAANLSLLAVFKYADFFAANLTDLARLVGWNYPVAALGLLLPIGLSFHTFQSMAYTIEVYRGTQRAERHLGYFALYVLFYPQLVAGPIERPQHLLPQLRRPPLLSERGLRGGLGGLAEPCLVAGLQLILLGLFKKLVIADRLALVVDPIYADPRLYSAAALVMATVFFAIQIYCDFSGYTHIARGAARTMGVDLTHNFLHPYGARSITEFWRRWHVSLSSWFRDYVYIPAGGGRSGAARWARNILITFLLSGLWHGASWTFVIWGAVHGLYLIAGHATRDLRARLVAASGLSRWPLLHARLQAATVFALATFAWIFFRSATLSDAWYVITQVPAGIGTMVAVLGGAGGDGLMVWLGLAGLPIARHEWALMLALVAAVLALDQRRSHEPIVVALAPAPVWLRAAAAYVLIGGVLFFGVYRTATFIYFQF